MMICMIVGNGGYMCLILSIFVLNANSFVREKITTIQDFCSGNSFIRNIEPGEPFKLILKSEEQITSGGDKWYKKSKRKCKQEYKTSDASAHFIVAISNMNIPSCDINCRCNYLEIEVYGHRKRFCGIKDDYFQSKSDRLSIEFHHGSSMRFDVSLTFTVERNVYIITGVPKNSIYSSNFIETPYFPTPYPPNYRAEYIFQANDPSSHVSLLFLDFQISARSFIEVVGNNGTRPTRFYGDVFRPPVIVSQSNELSLKFQSNDQPGMPGFRALSSFIKSADTLSVPYTDCAESKDGKGGHIHIKTHERFGLYDCLWHIVPFSPFSRSNLSIFAHMRNISHKSTLEFRSGSNSKSEIVKKINCEKDNCNNLDIEIVVPASEYLYIRFNGYLDIYSAFNLSYTTYHMGDCSDKEFNCKDGRCLSIDFKCDGILNCPDGSDEEFCLSSVSVENEIPSVTSIQRDNLYSEDSYMYLILLGCFGLITFIISILIFAYKRYWKKHTAESFPNRISDELTDVQPGLYPVDSYNSDNPPSYDDFVKSSNFYPPLHYTHKSQCFIPKSPCTQCTTSFCSGARIRHYSADSIAPRNSETNSGDLFLNINTNVSHPEQSHNAYNVEIIQNNLSFKTSENTIRRSYSLDSRLNNMIHINDSCHFLLSIVHPSCTHGLYNLPTVQWYTLPPNFKYNTFKNCNGKQKINEWFKLDSNVNFSKDRRFTWSFVPCNRAHTEFVVKTRCFSEPCKSVSIHCSLY